MAALSLFGVLRSRLGLEGPATLDRRDQALAFAPGVPFGWRPIVFVGCLWLCVGMAPSAMAQKIDLVAPTEPLTAEEQLTKFHLPPGFKIELIAAEPDCQKPMNLKFDAAGRLFFTQSVEYPWPAKAGETGRDTIRVIVDTNDDGVPDRTQVFASGLNIPIGVVPVAEGVLGYSIPQLSFFPDRDGDLKADAQTPYYGDFGFRDTHGMCSSLTWWVDGWVYGCHGFSNESRVTAATGPMANRSPVLMQSGNTYRLRPEGGRIQQMTWGQVNPFGMTFDPLGNQYTSDCHTKPAYLLLRGAYYPSFGKPHDGLGFGPELMTHLHGSTGISGIVYYAAEHFPAEYRDNLFIGNPVTGRINRDSLAVYGSTLKAVERPDFITCDDPWFRPVDLQLAPDGTLYIADFYNRIIGHYEVPLTHPGRDRERGRIWRVSYVGPDGTQRPPQVPDVSQAKLLELVALLGHPHLPVRVQATHRLSTMSIDQFWMELMDRQFDEMSDVQQAHLVWVMLRSRFLLNYGPALPTWDRLLSSPHRLTRVHAYRALGEVGWWEMPDWRERVVRGLTDGDAFVRRAAVQTLMLHPQSVDPLPLIELWARTPADDELLRHSLKLTLRAIVDQQGIDLQGLQQRLAGTAAAATLDPLLADVALGAGPYAQGIYAGLLSQPTLPNWFWARGFDYAKKIGQTTSPAALARVQLVSEPPSAAKRLMTIDAPSLEARVAVVRGLQAGFREAGFATPAFLRDKARENAETLLRSAQGADKSLALHLVKELGLTSAAKAIQDAIPDDSPEPLRKLLLETLAAIDPSACEAVSVRWLSRPAEKESLQQSVVQVLGGLNRPESRAALAGLLKTAPQGLSLSIARGLALSKDGGEALLVAVEAGRGSPRLLQDTTVEQRLRGGNPTAWEARRNRLLEGLPAADERLATLQKARLQGFDPASSEADRGAVVYRAHCAACHKMNNQGGKVGPELDGIGVRGLERILEDTLDPNRNVDAAFRATVLALNDGKVLSGLLLREVGETVVIADEQGKEVTVTKDQIEERRLLPLSPMPANVAEKLSEKDFYDLMAYLLSQRVKSRE